MSQTLIQDWVTLAMAGRIDRVRTVLTLAAFGVSGVVWDGVSKIVKQYNYSAGVPFYITEIPDKPSDLNFGLALRYRVGSDVTRYKLWDVDGVDYAGEVYNGQVIKGNFVLEVWNAEDETDATLSEDVVFETGIRSVPSDLRSTGDIEITAPTEVSYAELLPTNSFTPVVLSDIASCRQWLVADDLIGFALVPGIVNSWEDRIQGSQWTQEDNAKAPLCYGGTVGIINGHKYVLFDGVNDYLKALGIVSPIACPATVYMLVAQVGWTLNDTLIGISNIAEGQNRIYQSAITPGIKAGVGSGSTAAIDGATVGEFVLVRLRFTATDVSAQICDIQINEDTAETLAGIFLENFTDGSFYLGSSVTPSSYANIKVVDLAIFADDTVTSGQDETIKAYFYSTYNIMGGVITPLPVYSESSYWLDND